MEVDSSAVEMDSSDDCSWLLKNPPQGLDSEFRPGYNRYRALLFSPRKTPQRYYESAIVDCPRLGTLNKNYFAKLAKDETADLSETRKLSLSMLALLIGSYLTIGSDSTSLATQLIFVVGITVVLIPILMLFNVLGRRRSEFLATRRTFLVVRALEKYRDYWNSMEFRTRIAAELELTAVEVGNIPLNLHGVAPRVKRDLLISSRRKAAAIRSLERSVIASEFSTYSEVMDVLIADFVSLVKGQWYNLPEADSESNASAWLVFRQISCVVLVVAVLIAVTSLASKPLASILIPVLAVAAIALLNKVGIPAETLGQYMDTGQKLVSKQ